MPSELAKWSEQRSASSQRSRIRVEPHFRRSRFCSRRQAQKVKQSALPCSGNGGFQICPGSSGSGSLMGTSGFSGGSTGSRIGEGHGSAAVRSSRSACSTFRCMEFRCQGTGNGSLPLQKADHIKYVCKSSMQLLYSGDGVVRVQEMSGVNQESTD